MSQARKIKTANLSLPSQHSPLTAAPPQKQTITAKPAGKGRDRRTMVAEAAYYLAEKRNFLPGCELDDWLMAEREIDLELHAP